MPLPRAREHHPAEPVTRHETTAPDVAGGAEHAATGASGDTGGTVVAMPSRTATTSTPAGTEATAATGTSTGGEPSAETTAEPSAEAHAGMMGAAAVGEGTETAAPQPRPTPSPATAPAARARGGQRERVAPAARQRAGSRAATEGGSLPSLAGIALSPPSAPPANVARIKASKRGKRDVNYSWPKRDYAAMQAAWEECKPLYSRYWRREDPGGAYRLGFSAFVAKAMLVAFENPDAWLDTVRNDGRLEPVEGGRQQVGLVWPVEVENQVIDLWESLDRSRFPAGFSLTKQHLAAAAILHGLETRGEWLLQVGNDDRFSVPVEGDGRLRANRAAEPSLA